MLDKIPFTKMETCGNDYIYFDCFHNNIDIESIKPFIEKLCDRNFGIGADGVIFIIPSDKANSKMIMFNKDGSETKMCGHGIRSVAKYIYDTRITRDDNFKIETKSGIKNVKINTNNGIISINIGSPSFNSHLIPVRTDKSFFVREPIYIFDQTFLATSLSMGNPHTVIEAKNIDKIDLDKYGPKIECFHLFPEKTNVEFVEKIDDECIKMRVWERGTGETLSCGSGACASVAAFTFTRQLKNYTPITVLEKGGKEIVECRDDGIIFSGSANTIYEGNILIKK